MFSAVPASVADSGPFDTDPDPAFQFDTYPDPDPAFQFDTDPDPDPAFQFDTYRILTISKR